MHQQHVTKVLRAGPTIIGGMLIVLAFQPAFGQTIPVLDGAIEEVYRSDNDPGWLEGPAYDGAGGVWFTEHIDPFIDPLPATFILRFDILSGATDVVISDAGGANGLLFDHEGRLIAPEGINGRVTRRNTGQLDQVEVIAENWNGAPLVAPNDAVIDADGGIYFTDFVEPPPESAVYYISPGGAVEQVVKGIPINNGIGLSPSGDTLYVASTLGVNGDGIFALDVAADGSLSNQRVFANVPGFVPDGMTVDRFGNVYAADLALVGGPPPHPGLPGSQVRVWNSAGEEVLTFAPPEGAINLTFAPDDMLYFTSQKSLLRVPISFVPEPSSATIVMISLVAVAIRRRPMNLS